MLWKRGYRNLRNQLSANTVETTRKLAREKTRYKPEDIQKSHFLFGFGAAIVSFFKRLAGFFRFRSRKYRPVNHASGFFGRFVLDRRNPKWFRALQKRHLGEIPFALNRRQARKYALRGQGYLAPIMPE
jgi:hypothetical protein